MCPAPCVDGVEQDGTYRIAPALSCDLEARNGVVGCLVYRHAVLEYSLADYDPLTDGDEVEWARRVDEQGWRARSIAFDASSLTTA